MGEERSSEDALEGRDEGVEARLAWALGHFPFTLDPFQVKAVRHLLAGEGGRACSWGRLGPAGGWGMRWQQQCELARTLACALRHAL